MTTHIGLKRLVIVSRIVVVLPVLICMSVAPGLARADANELQRQLSARARAKIRAHVLAVLAASPTPEFMVEVDAAEANAFREQMESRMARSQILHGFRQRLETIKAPLLQRMRHAILEHRDYDHLPYVYMRVRNQDALVRILEDPAVVAVYEIQEHEPTTAESLPAIHQPESVRYDAFRGQSTAVAVLDTGVDFRRPVFNSCTAAGAPANCRVVFAQDFAPNDGMLDDDGHGTNVAAIVAQTAPGTNIIALDVFTLGNFSNCVVSPCHRARTPEVIAAINWVVANRAQFNIVAMNLSLGSGNYTPATCPGMYTAAFQAARQAGVLPIVAAGNDGLINGLDSPACEPDAVAVGAVYDGNLGFDVMDTDVPCTDAAPQAQYQVTCFSNSHPAVAILAPGARITAGGSIYSGTSQATPHVAGAAAIVSAVNPNLPPNAVRTALLVSQTFSTDAKSGVTTPVLDLRASILDASPHTPAVEAILDAYYAMVSESQLLDMVGYMHEVNNLAAVRSRVLAPFVLIAIGILQ